LFATRESPLRLAGRVLESVGSLAGWRIARRDTAGKRFVVATGEELEVIATPFMPIRTVSEAEKLRVLNVARRDTGFRRASMVTDERVY